jgi:hypothetical protein
MSFFIKNEGFDLLRKKFFFMVIFQNGFSPKAASRQSRIFGYPENPEVLEVKILKSSNSPKSRSLKIGNWKILINNY